MERCGTIPKAAGGLLYHGGNINGARHLFPNAPQWLPRIFPAQRVGILGFTYEEHERCWRAGGAEVTKVAALSDLVAFDVGVVVNPNNPDGRTYPPEILAETAVSFARHGGLLIVDEAFMDVLGRRNSLVPGLPEAGALVLRSFGKIYGLAGLRLGFAAASQEAGAMLRRAIGPWAVSGPALEIGQRALMDESWLTKTVVRLCDDADRLDRLLRAAGFDIVGGTPLFRLAQHKDAARWFEQLARAGILTRPFEAKPDWLRFGIPQALADWDRLDAAIRDSFLFGVGKPLRSGAGNARELSGETASGHARPN
jgi:cobalamin biosynthetic protein CobC